MTRVRVFAISLIVAFGAVSLSTAGSIDGAWAAGPATGLRVADQADGEKDGAKAGGKKGKGNVRKARKEARKLVKKGQALIRAKKYDEGIIHMEAAYELDPRAENLYNLGVAYHLKGDKEKAYEYYQKVLAGKPNRRLARLAERFSNELVAEMDAEKAAREAKEKEAARKEAADTKLGEIRSELEDTRRELTETRTRLAETEAERDRLRTSGGSGGGGGGRGKRLIGSFLMVVGGAAAGMGVGYGLVARSTSREVEGLTPGEDQWSDSLRDLGEESDQRFLILSAAGGGVLVLGAVLYFWGEAGASGDSGPAEKLSIVPAVGSDSAGVQVTGRF